MSKGNGNVVSVKILPNDSAIGSFVKSTGVATTVRLRSGEDALCAACSRVSTPPKQ